MRKKEMVGIKRVNVQGLFGHYDYDIDIPDTHDLNQIAILYGENGSGKTTILRLIFHLLASERAKGHKSYIAETKFRNLKIELTNGVKICASREDSIVGSFFTELHLPNENIEKVFWKSDSSFAVKVSSNSDEDKTQNDFLSKVESLDISLYLLSDDRTVQASSGEKTSSMRTRGLPYRQENEEYQYYENAISEQPIRSLSPEAIWIRLLTKSIENAFDWFRRQVVKDSRKGESDVNLLYADIVKNLVNPPVRDEVKKKITKEKLCEMLSEIGKKSKRFQRFGLSPSFNSRDMIAQIGSAKKPQWSSIQKILVPYVNSTEAKFKALEEVQTRIETLIDTFNSFFSDKEVDFKISTGFSIKSNSGEELEPRMLSSGERNLFLLFCNTITSLDKQSIFFIDEPELSLNVKWQRRLLDCLSDCSKNSCVQYIFASHSMEIIAQHLNRVIKLENKGQ